MSVLLLEQDPFVGAEASTLAEPPTQQNNIRRPFYGMSTQAPSAAFLSVYQDGGGGSLVPISMKDSSAPGGWSNANHNFLLTSVQEVHTEKTQIMETFGDHYVFFFGERPIVLVVQGMLLDTPDFNWKNEWLYNYYNFLRGTKCVENRARVFLGYNNRLVQGYVMNCQTVESNDQPAVTPISFQMLLAKAPLDYSPASGSDVPNPGTTVYVSQSSEGRTLRGTTDNVEYLDDSQPQEEDHYVINDLTGESMLISESDAYDAAASASTAASSLDVTLVAAVTGVDEVTAATATRNGATKTSLNTRSPSTTAIQTSLGQLNTVPDSGGDDTGYVSNVAIAGYLEDSGY